MPRQRLRRHIDGSFWLARNDKEYEKELDETYVRVPGARRWFPIGYNKELAAIENTHTGKSCYILGKGPSLDSLTEEDFKPDIPIICVNDSIKKINTLKLSNPVFVIQQDGSLKEECRPLNKDSILILSRQSKSWYADYANRITMTPVALGLQEAGPTVILAITIAKFIGCKFITFMAFDAATDKNCNYASVIGYSATRAGKPQRFLSHKEKMFNALEQAKIDFEFYNYDPISLI